MVLRVTKMKALDRASTHAMLAPKWMIWAYVLYIPLAYTQCFWVRTICKIVFMFFSNQTAATKRTFKHRLGTGLTALFGVSLVSERCINGRFMAAF